MSNLIAFSKCANITLSTQFSRLMIARNLASFKNIFGNNEKSNEKDKQPENVSFANQDQIEKDSNLSNEQTIKLRRVKAYFPDKNIESEIKKLSQEVFKTINDDFKSLKLADPIDKFNLLTKCMTKFKHNIPNTSLNDIKTIGDLVNYFKTEIKDTSSLEDLKQNPDLPPNLHINLEYNRFDPTTDTFFNGKDAFPKRDTVVSSLWYSKKYKPVIKKKDYFSK